MNAILLLCLFVILSIIVMRKRNHRFDNKNISHEARNNRDMLNDQRNKWK